MSIYGQLLKQVDTDVPYVPLFSSYSFVALSSKYTLPPFPDYAAFFSWALNLQQSRHDRARLGLVHRPALVTLAVLLVVISFVVFSLHGPLRYATDAHERQYAGLGMEGWQADVGAIALALTALRAVDRYGVSRRGEQYTGWRALPATSGVTFPSPLTRRCGGCARSQITVLSMFSTIADCGV